MADRQAWIYRCLVGTWKVATITGGTGGGRLTVSSWGGKRGR